MTGRKIISLATSGAAAMAISCANTRRKVKAIFNDRGGSSSRVPVCQCNSIPPTSSHVTTDADSPSDCELITSPGHYTPTQQLTGVWSHCTQCPVSSVRLLGSEHKNMQIFRLFVMWWSCWIFAAWPSCGVSSCPNKTPRCHQALTQYQYLILYHHTTISIYYCIITDRGLIDVRVNAATCPQLHN